MKNNIIKKLAAVFVTAAMIGTGFSLVSAADVSDIEIQSEEAVEVLSLIHISEPTRP